MAITVDAVLGSDGITSTSSQITLPFTVGTGANQCLVATFQGRDGGGFSSVIWNNSEALLPGASIVAGNGLVSAIYYLPNPTPGLHNIVGNTSGQTWLGCTAYSLFGVAQSSPVDDTDIVETSGTDPSFSSLVTTVDNCIVIDSISTNASSTGDIAMTAETNRFLIAKFLASSSTPLDGRTVASSRILPKSPAGSVTMQWTISGANSAVCAVALKPAAPSGNPAFAYAQQQ